MLESLDRFFVYFVIGRRRRSDQIREVFIGKDLSRSLVNSPAQSRVGCEIRSGCSGLGPGRS